MRIGVDLDGCLYDWHIDMQEWLLHSTGVEYPKPTTWNFSDKEWGMTQEDFQKHWHAGVRAGHVFRKQPPLAQGVEVLSRLAHQHDLYIITSRLLPGLEEDCTRNTMGWIEEHLIPHKEVHIVGHGKTEICNQLGIEIIIDDAVHNYEDLLKTSTVPVMLTMPWNVHYEAQLRAANWLEFEQIVSEYAAKGRD